VFLAGVASEIETTRRDVNDIYAVMTPVLIAPLYAGLPQQHKIAAFSPAPKGQRRIVLSTTLPRDHR